MVSNARSRMLGPVVSETLLLLLTIAISIGGVALLIFLPRAFLGHQASQGSYFGAVGDYLRGWR